jgi:hypothetical protein
MRKQAGVRRLESLLSRARFTGEPGFPLVREGELEEQFGSSELVLIQLQCCGKRSRFTINRQALIEPFWMEL